MSDRETPTCTAFIGTQLLASGPRLEVALAVKYASERDPTARVLIFEDTTGRSIDFDLRGTADDIAARLEAPTESRGRGRPKLGVTAREVTLLPRHWEWLQAQPGGASAALRRLVEAARRDADGKQRRRAAQEVAYRFMSAMAGNFVGFEEAIRALFADDRVRFTQLIADWPPDVRDHATKLAN